MRNFVNEAWCAPVWTDVLNAAFGSAKLRLVAIHRGSNKPTPTSAVSKMTAQSKLAGKSSPYSEQYVPCMKRAWKWLEDNYSPKGIWMQKGTEMLAWYAAIHAHGDLPISCAFLALASASSNGALTHLYGDDLTPLFAWFLNNNYPQTRKTEVTKILARGAAALDELIKANFEQKWETRLAAVNAERARRNQEPLDLPRPIIETVEIANMTPTEMFVRLAGDWPMVTNASECFADRWGLAKDGRIFFSSLVNDDEFYQKATDFQLITGDSKKLTEVSEHQSSLNRVATLGDVKRATKSAGQAGMHSKKKVNLGGASNLHPALGCPLQSHDVGQHVVACIERFVTVTQRPVQPHEMIPQDLTLPESVPRGKWITLRPRVIKELGLASLLADRAQLERIPETAVPALFVQPSTQAGPDNGVYYFLKLPDQTALPLVFAAGVPYVCVGNRALSSVFPAEYKVEAFVKRIFDIFKNAPNSQIGWEDSAREAFDAFALAENVKAGRQRFVFNDPEGASAYAIAPLRFGVLAPLLALFDIGSTHTPSSSAEEAGSQGASPRSVEVAASHVERAYELYLVFAGLREKSKPVPGDESMYSAFQITDIVEEEPGTDPAQLLPIEEQDVMKKLLLNTGCCFSRASVAMAKYYQQSDAKYGDTDQKIARFQRCVARGIACGFWVSWESCHTSQLLYVKSRNMSNHPQMILELARLGLDPAEVEAAARNENINPNKLLPLYMAYRAETATPGRSVPAGTSSSSTAYAVLGSTDLRADAAESLPAAIKSESEAVSASAVPPRTVGIIRCMSANMEPARKRQRLRRVVSSDDGSNLGSIAEERSVQSCAQESQPPAPGSADADQNACDNQPESVASDPNKAVMCQEDFEADAPANMIVEPAPEQCPAAVLADRVKNQRSTSASTSLPGVGLADVLDFVGVAAVERASDERVQVLTCKMATTAKQKMTSHKLTATVGSATVPGIIYTVNCSVVLQNGAVLFQATRGKGGSRRRGPIPSDMCSCPSTAVCKHIAAALVHVATASQAAHSMDPCDDGTPAEVHALAVALHDAGVIGATNVEQRRRNRPKSTFSAPKAYMKLLEYGYVSPNYSWAPQGHKWGKPSSGGAVFALKPKGG